jgi:hypothetical protein
MSANRIVLSTFPLNHPIFHIEEWKALYFRWLWATKMSYWVRTQRCAIQGWNSIIGPELFFLKMVVSQHDIFSWNAFSYGIGSFPPTTKSLLVLSRFGYSCMRFRKWFLEEVSDAVLRGRGRYLGTNRNKTHSISIDRCCLPQINCREIYNPSYDIADIFVAVLSFAYKLVI